MSSAQVTVQDAAGGGEVLFAGGISGTQNAQIQAPPHKYTFRLYDTSSGSAVLIASTDVLATGTGSIAGSPNPCMIPSGATSCASTIAWSTQNATSAKVTIQDSVGGGETVFATTTSGSQNASIQAPPHQYTLRLYDTSSGTPLLIAATTVAAEGTGTISGSPNPCAIPAGFTSCDSTITWSVANATSAQVTVEDAVGGGEVFFSNGVSGSQTALIQAPPHKYTFRLYDTSSGTAFLLTATVVLAEGSATISASPNPCPIQSGATSCTTTVTWNVVNALTAKVTEQDAAGGGEVTFATQLSSSQTAQIQPAPHSYNFRVYDTSSGSSFFLTSTTVVATGSGAITASPNPCPVPGGSTSCTTTVNWTLLNATSAQVTVQDAFGGGEVLFATGVSGSQTYPIQLPPHKYTFRLYDTSLGFNFLITATVVQARGTGMISASPDPCQISSGQTSCTSTITWSTQNVSAAEITVQDAVGGGEQSFTTGLSGSANAQIQAPPHQYTFTLYDISSGTRLWLDDYIVVAKGTGTISASPNPCTILSGATSCNSTISWSTQTVTSAKVTVEDAAGGGEQPFATGTSGSQTAQIQGAPHSYNFRLYDSSSGTSYFLAAVTVTGGSPPAAPSNLTATAGITPSGTDFVNLAWQDNSNNESNFLIQRCQVVTRGKKTTCGFSVIATVGANVTTYQDTSVVRRATYKYFVQAKNSFGTSAASNVVLVTTP